MAAKKYNSPKLKWAKERQSKIKSISAEYDFGKNFNALHGDTQINTLQTKQDKYNDLKSELDALRLEITESENEVIEFYVGALTRIESEHGRNSREYEIAGGIPKSKRKPPKRTARPVKKE